MFLADLHIHSRFSRATSKNCAPETLDLSAREKGLHVIGTGDFTHPAWRAELNEKLIPAEEGLYRLREEFVLPSNLCDENLAPRFLLSSEISCIYKKNGRTRKVHSVILLPNLEKAEALSKKLETIGNLHSDGRPILGLDSKDLLELTLEACPEAIFIPAHIWTPHFSLFGAYSGFDTIEECFEDLTPHIHALETGLSSDPPMNWQLSALDRYTLVSNSDAHSPANLAREANIFNTALSYPAIAHALAHPQTEEFYGTLEFFPEEGKYHFDGHRNCGVCLSPEQSNALEGLCPVCGKRLTTGVSHRVAELADHPLGRRAPHAKHFESIVPLSEALGSCLGFSAGSVKVRALREALLQKIGPELYLLREAPIEQLKKEGGPLIAEGIRQLRAGRVEAQPGFDGEYGKVQLLSAEQRAEIQGQLSFFATSTPAPTPPKKSAAAKLISQPAVAIAAEKGYPREHHGLNALQWQAASCSCPVTAVIAGPGTGKTRTLVARTAYLISDCAVPASHITAVTFTNQAAVEMRERLAGELGRSAIRALNIGTFHSICYSLLKKWKMELPILEESDALLLCREAAQSLGLKTSPKNLLHRISGVKNGVLMASELPEGVMAQYSTLLERYHVMDYDDILLKTIAVLEEGSKKTQKSLIAFSHILVDEFQDINPIQYRLLRLWSRSGGSLFCIGDPNQSIYGFRGADASCFPRLASDYSSVAQISLEENYRSSPEILGCSQPVVRSKALQATQPSGEKVQVIRAKSALSEGIFVAHQIIERMGGIDMLGAHAGKKKSQRSLSFSDIAVLYRTHRQAAQLEYCLKKEGIPYVVVGREDFLSAPSVRHALNFFRSLLEPNNLLAQRYCQEEAETPALQSFRGRLLGSSALAEASAQQLLLEFAEYQGVAEDAAFERLLCIASQGQKLRDFLGNLSLGQESDFRRSGSRSYALDAVTLSTLHGAKGLEFDSVFLCGVNKGFLPLQNVGAVDPGEERRLFYVGMTRAKTSLTLCYYGEPSPFLCELPSAFFEAGSAGQRKKVLAKQLNLFE